MTVDEGVLTFTVPLPEGLGWLNVIGKSVTISSEEVPGLIDGETAGIVEKATKGDDGVLVVIKTIGEFA